jgi:ATP-dependent Lon protease
MNNKPIDFDATTELRNIVKNDKIIDILTKSELRRLKADVKAGSRLKDSQIIINATNRLSNSSTNSSSNKKRKNCDDTAIKHSTMVPPQRSSILRKAMLHRNKRFKSKKHYDSDDTESSVTPDDSLSSENLSSGNDVTDNDNDNNITSGFIKHMNNEFQNRSFMNKQKKILNATCKKNKIDCDKIIEAKFNEFDTEWFYKAIYRLDKLEGKEYFDQEDKIEKRFKLLKSLQENNMYHNFNSNISDDITKEVLSSKHSENVKSILLNKLYNTTNESIEEYQKCLIWANTILNLPTEVKSTKQDISTSIKKLHEKLNASMNGMDDVIRQILQAVCTILTDPDNSGYILTLVGQPGVGKTTISTLISEAIGMGFGQISCGSINDQAIITGHGSTYIGSKPGIFTQIQIASKQMDNVVLLDEMDKLPDSKIIPILLHILDKSQNNRFKDAFCPEVDVDLSKNLYIIAVNSIDSFDDALKDRLKIVNVTGYNIEQKCQICVKHIIPKIMRKTKINKIIEYDAMKRCIQSISPNISGVREIERFIGDIYEKLALINYMGPSYFNMGENFDINNFKTIKLDLICKLTNIQLL